MNVTEVRDVDILWVARSSIPKPLLPNLHRP